MHFPCLIETALFSLHSSNILLGISKGGSKILSLSDAQRGRGEEICGTALLSDYQRLTRRVFTEAKGLSPAAVQAVSALRDRVQQALFQVIGDKSTMSSAATRFGNLLLLLPALAVCPSSYAINASTLISLPLTANEKLITTCVETT